MTSEELATHVAYSPYLRQFAIRVARASLGDRFYAIHGRLGDETRFWKGKQSGDAFVRTPTFRKWDTRLKCYLASDDPENGFFRELKKAINVVTANDLKGKEIDELRSLFPDDQVRQDMLGVLDKLICAQAIDFMGSPVSTFSKEIKQMRAITRYVFPELLNEPSP